MWLKLSRIFEMQNAISRKYDCYTCHDYIVQVLLVTPYGNDNYLVHCWNGDDIFTFVDDGQERYALVTV